MKHVQCPRCGGNVRAHVRECPRCGESLEGLAPIPTPRRPSDTPLLPDGSPFVGRWGITTLDGRTPRSDVYGGLRVIEFRRDLTGHLEFAAGRANLEYRPTAHDLEPAVEFSWRSPHNPLGALRYGIAVRKGDRLKGWLPLGARRRIPFVAERGRLLEAL